jgi:anti-anti-sigma factor
MENFKKKLLDRVVIEVVNLNNPTIKDALEFKNIIEEDMRSSESHIIVDLSECDQIDSTFMGVLVVSMKKMKSNSRELVLIEPVSNKAKGIFSVTDTYKVFRIHKTLDEALTYLKSVEINPETDSTYLSTELNLAWGVGLSRE